MNKRKIRYRLIALLTAIVVLAVYMKPGSAVIAQAETVSGYFVYDILEDASVKITGLTFSGKAAVQSDGVIFIPGTLDQRSVTELGRDVFRQVSYASYLKKVVIDDGITVIEDSAFYALSNLASVTLPDTLVSIGDGCFANSGLTSAVIPGGVSRLSDGVFDACPSLKSVTLKEGVEEIGAVTFRNDSGLTTILFPQNSLKRIGWQAFTGCTSLRDLELPSTVTEIGGQAFQGCINLKKLTLPADLVELGENAVPEDQDLMIIVPKGLTDISGLGLENLSGVKIYVIEDSEAAHYLEQKNVVYYTYGTEETEPPAPTETLGMTEPPAPTESPEVTQTPVPTETPVETETSAPTETPGMTESPAPTESPKETGTPIPTETPGENDTPEPTQAPISTESPKVTESPMPTGTAEATVSPDVIGPDTPTITLATNKNYSVNGNKYKVLSGKKAAFIGCTSKKVQKLNIPSTVQLGGHKYQVTTIANSACKGYKNLKNVTIGENIKTIGKHAFLDCGQLKQVTIKSRKLKSVGKAAFRKVPATLVIKVPKGKIRSYKKMIQKSK